MNRTKMRYDEDTNTGGLNVQKENAARPLRPIESGRRPGSEARATAESAGADRDDELDSGIRHDSGGQLEEQPVKITAIYDNGGRSLDRYTILTDQQHNARLIMALGVGDNPDDYSQWTGAQIGDHLGKKTTFESLSAIVQGHIAKRIFEV